MNKRAWLFFCVLSLLPITGNCTNTVLKYNLGTSGSSVPYENAVDEKRAGILVEILPLIMQRAGIKTEKVMLSTKRAMIAFNTGKLDFDFFSQSWLPPDAPVGNFSFSDAILTVKEYFITLPENQEKYADVNVIYGNPVGTISGYVYFDEDQFERLDFDSESSLLLALGRKRIDVIIMEEASSRYWSSKYDIDIALGPIHTQGELALRVHNRHKDKLPRINEAIAHLKATGQIQAILKKYSDFSL